MRGLGIYSCTYSIQESLSEKNVHGLRYSFPCVAPLSLIDHAENSFSVFYKGLLAQAFELLHKVFSSRVCAEACMCFSRRIQLRGVCQSVHSFNTAMVMLDSSAKFVRSPPINYTLYLFGERPFSIHFPSFLHRMHIIYRVLAQRASLNEKLETREDNMLI